MKKKSNKFEQCDWVRIFAGKALKLETVGPTFSSFNPCPSFPSLAVNDGKQFQCLNYIILSNTTTPLFLEFYLCI